MSVYSVKGKGWRYDFTLKGQRYTEAWFKTKTEAKQAEAEKRKEVENPKPVQETGPTDMAFLDLVNLRLDHVKAYNSKNHFQDVLYHARRWVGQWPNLACSDITHEMVEQFIIQRAETSPFVANKEIRNLRALFNYGIKLNVIGYNPVENIKFLPVEKNKKYVPPESDVRRIISVADPDAQHYLWTILLTAGRVNEINSLTWEDVDFEERLVTLWTRKRRGGNKEPRDVPMVPQLYDILLCRYENRNKGVSYVFCHEYWSRKSNEWVVGPYKDRKRLMKSLCDTAGVKYFRFHAMRHLTASMLDNMGIPIGVIQRILGHKNRKTTEIYLHSVSDEERKAMDKLGETYFSSPVDSIDIEQPTNKPPSFWRRKVDRPSYDVLAREIEDLGYVGVGKKYGVSDNAVRKWKTNYEKERTVEEVS